MRDSGVDAPAHRWTATVVLLVALASLPTLAAVSAGSASLDETTASDGTTPFIAQPSGLPAVIVPDQPVALPPVSGTEPAPAGHPAHQGAVPRSAPRTPRPDAPTFGSPARPPAARPAQPACGSSTALGWRPLLRRPTQRDCTGAPANPSARQVPAFGDGR